LPAALNRHKSALFEWMVSSC